MRVLGVRTSAELDGLVTSVKRAVEPTEESVDVCKASKISFAGCEKAKDTTYSLIARLSGQREP